MHSFFHSKSLQSMHMLHSEHILIQSSRISRAQQSHLNSLEIERQFRGRETAFPSKVQPCSCQCKMNISYTCNLHFITLDLLKRKLIFWILSYSSLNLNSMYTRVEQATTFQVLNLPSLLSANLMAGGFPGFLYIR